MPKRSKKVTVKTTRVETHTLEIPVWEILTAVGAAREEAIPMRAKLHIDVPYDSYTFEGSDNIVIEWAVETESEEVIDDA